MELTINNTVFTFRFGMGFLREINKRVTVPVEGLKDVKQNIGLRYYISGIMDGDVESLVEVLDIANKTESPRLTKAALDSYIESDDTDVDELFKQVIDFLKSANATRKTTGTMLETLEAQRKKQ